VTEPNSYSGIPLKAFYRPEDSAADDNTPEAYARHLNDPGAFPFTRGNRVNNSAWIQRELSGEGDPVRSNEQFQYLLSHGQTGIDVIGDAPTMSWMDPDHPLSRHAVGTQGVSVCTADDYRALYHNLPLDKISVSNSLPAPFAIAGLFLTAREAGVDPRVLRGSVVQFVLYGEDCSYAVNLPLPLRLRLACDSIMFCSREMPRFHSFLEDTYYISEAGLDAVEEMAMGFVEIRYVVRELLRRGVDIDSFAPRIAFLVNCRMDLFEEIAKIRASRRLFARMMQEEFGAQDPRSLSIVVSSHTSGLCLTAQQPFNNIARGALQALALALAGVQAVEISAFDEAYRTPSPESHLVGLRTQQVIQRETNVNQVTDPLGGSYFMESLTDQIEARIEQMVDEIERAGDPGRLADDGWFKGIFINAMERYARGVDTGTVPKVGVNTLQLPPEQDTLLKDVAERKIEPCHDRIAALAAHRVNRPQAPCHAALAALQAAARDPEADLMGPIVAAMEAGATMGEMVGIMRRVYGMPYDPFNMVQAPIPAEG